MKTFGINKSLLNNSTYYLVNYGKNLENLLNKKFNKIHKNQRYRLYQKYIVDEMDDIYGLKPPRFYWSRTLTKLELVVNIGVFEAAIERLDKHLTRSTHYVRSYVDNKVIL